MSIRPIRQIRKSTVRSLRTALHALLAGLIPPPLVVTIAPSALAATAAALLPKSSVALAQSGITGVIYRDYDANGTRDNVSGDINTAAQFPEPGVGGLTVTAFPASGDGTSGAVTTTTANDGSFTLATTDTGAWRIEVTGLPDYLQPGAAGASTVVFANDGDNNIEIGVNTPADYSQDDPVLTTVMMSQGAATGTFSGNTGLLSLKRSAVGQSASAGTVTGVPTDGAFTELSTFGEVGAAFGIAWNRTDNQLYTSAYHKHLVGYGPGGRGQIYRTPVNPLTGAATGATAAWVNVENDLGITVCGAHGTDINEPPAYDQPVFNQVGRCGLGGIDISYDDSTLYVVNIDPAQLLAVSTADGSLADSWTIPVDQVTGCAGIPLCLGSQR